MYRKKPQSDTWHWCRNCSHWPTHNYVQRRRKPLAGLLSNLCNECRRKEKVGKCRK
jgi:hypothetical protein